MTAVKGQTCLVMLYQLISHTQCKTYNEVLRLGTEMNLRMEITCIQNVVMGSVTVVR
jgi:hypothetical protein